MKTLHFYLLRQVVVSMLLTVTVFTFVLLLGNLLREILLLLVSHRVGLLAVVQAVLLLVPFVLVFALPMGLLTATLLVFGRFSADQELTAARAGGVSLVALISPIILLSVVVCGLTGWFNLYLAPSSRVAYKELLYGLGMQKPTALLSENQFVKDFPGYVIYVGKVLGPDTVRNVLVYKMDTNAPPETVPVESRPEADAPATPRVSMILWAPEARIELNPTNQTVTLFMPEVQGVYLDSWQPGDAQNQTVELPARMERPRRQKLKISEMTFSQLLTEYYDWRRRGIDATPVAVQIHRQAAFSFAPISFTLIGIPLGIRAHRRETSAGIGIAIVLLLVYYSFIVLAQAWETYPQRHPEWLLWAPNFLFQALGAGLLWRANRQT